MNSKKKRKTYLHSINYYWTITTKVNVSKSILSLSPKNINLYHGPINIANICLFIISLVYNLFIKVYDNLPIIVEYERKFDSLTVTQ